jgi:large conductance mechanosensitive channel
MKGFLNFIREQGVMGLAVGFLLGGAVSKLVTALINDVINPLLSLVLGVAGNFKEASLQIGSSKLMWGDFLAALIDFAVIAAVVYYGVHGLGLDKIDKKKDKQ